MLQGVEVRTVRRQKQHFGTSLLDEANGFRVLVHDEVVEDHPMMRFEARNKELLDEKPPAVLVHPSPPGPFR